MSELQVVAFKVIRARVKLFKSLVPYGFFVCLFSVFLDLLIIHGHFTSLSRVMLNIKKLIYLLIFSP